MGGARHLVALDFDPSVTGIVSQPFWLVWPGGKWKPRKHAKDFLVLLAGGGVLSPAWCIVP